MFVQNVYAQPLTDVQLTPLTDVNSIADALAIILNIVVGIGIALVVIFLVFGGIQYVMSKGDPKAAATAQQAITNAIIGFVIIVGALTIKIIVGNIIGGGNVTIENVTPF